MEISELEIDCFYWLYAKNTNYNNARDIGEGAVTIGKYAGISDFSNQPLFYTCGNDIPEDLHDWTLGAKAK